MSLYVFIEPNIAVRIVRDRSTQMSLVRTAHDSRRCIKVALKDERVLGWLGKEKVETTYMGGRRRTSTRAVDQ